MVGKIQLAKTGFIAIALICAASKANAESKIFINGAWHDAQAASEINNNAQGVALPQLLPQANNTWSQVNLANAFIKANRELLGAVRENRFLLSDQASSQGLQTVRLARTWNLIPVLGGEVLVHSTNGKVAFASGDSVRFDTLDAKPSITSNTAATIAFASYNGAAAEVKKNELKVITLPEDQERIARLTYAVTIKDRDGISSDTHYIDAHTGQEILSTTNVHTISQRKVMAAEGKENDFELDTQKYDVIYHDIDCKAGACKTAKSREVMDSATHAWKNSGLVYSYFLKKHARKSIDNKSMEIRSVVNFGEKFSNAAWIEDHGIMIYGMGDNALYNDFATALDVAAHELTHGITSKTAKLVYVAESGALNESYSDVFGKLVAFEQNPNEDWRLGKEIFKDGKSAIRDMKNPAIDHTSKYRYRGENCQRLNDWCGVHSNSGIPNRAAVIIADTIGKEKMGKIYYLTLTQLLKSNSGFKEARAQTEAACAYLYGERSRDCQVVREAFSTVGISL